MTDFANLGLEIDSTSAKTAADDLDRLTESGKKTETQFEGVGHRLSTMGVTMEEMNRRAKAFGETMGQSTATTAQSSKETDRFIKSLEHQAETVGMTRAQVLALKASKMEFNDAQAMSVATSLAAIASFENQGKALDGLGLSGQRARNSLGLLTQDLLRGNFAGASQQLGRFVQSSDMSLAAIVRFVLPTAAAVATVVAFAKAFDEGEKEVINMNRAMDVSGNIAGVTRQQMLDLADSISGVGKMTIGTSKELVTGLVGSGQIGAQALASVAAVASDLAAATGRDVAKIMPELIKLFGDPAKGAEELNKQMHFLSPSQIRHIQELERIGDLTGAQIALADALGPRLAGQAEKLGSLSKAWDFVGQAASKAWDFMMNIGRPETLEQQLVRAERALSRMGATPDPISGFGGAEQIAAQQARIAQLRADIEKERMRVAEAAGTAESNRLQTQASALIGQISSRARLSEIEDRIQLARKFEATTTAEEVDKQNTIANLEKQRIETMKSMQGEARVLADMRIQDEVKIAEISNRGEKERIELLYKTGEINQADRDRRLFAADAVLTAEKMIGVQRQIELGNITQTERARFQTTLRLLDEERKLRLQNLEISEKMRNFAYEAAQRAADAASRGATATSQLGDIQQMQRANEALRERQKELGLTREQVDLLRQAETLAAIKRLELEVNQTISGGTPEDDPYVQRLLRQIELLKERSDLEVRTDTVSLREAQYNAELEALKRARDQQILTQNEYDEAELDLRTRHEWELTGIVGRGATERFKFMQMTTAQQTKVIIGQLTEMTAGAAQHNKTMFEINKLASTANAIVKGIEAVQSSYAFGSTWGGPVGGAAMAAIAFAATAVQVAAIQATTFQGGGRGTPPSLAGSTASGSVTPLGTPASAFAPEKEVPRQSTSISFYGTTDERKLLRRFVDMLNENSSDGGRISIVENR